MKRVVVELPVEQIKLGTYVSRLDRPWAETPFLFQGFTVASDEDLQLLRSLCKVVYAEVSIEEAEELKSARRAPATPREPRPPEPLEELSANPAAFADRVPIKDAVELKTELTLATTSFGEARRAVGAIFDHLRRGGGARNAGGTECCQAHDPPVRCHFPGPPSARLIGQPFRAP